MVIDLEGYSGLTQNALPGQLHVDNPIPRIEFDKYVLKKHDVIPKDLDLRGAIIIERDTKHQGFLHFLLWIAQKIHAFFCGTKGVDINLCHGSIIMGRGQKPNDLIVNHSALSRGIATSKLNHTEHKQVTGCVIYVPKNQALRDIVFEYSKQTCYDSRGKYGNVVKKNLAEFSVGDMVGSLFHGMKKNPSEDVKRRTAKVVADLLMGNQLLDHSGKKKHKFFCVPYVSSLLVGSHLILSLEEGEKEWLLQKNNGTKRSRSEVAHLIYHSIRKKIPTNSLSKAYWDNEISRQDLRFLISGQFARIIDKVSTTRNF